MMENKFLVVIDMQNDFIDGPLGTPEAKSIVPKVAEKIKAYKDYVFFTRDCHGENFADTLEGKKIPSHCITGTDGWKFAPEVDDVVLFNRVFDKGSFGSFDIATEIYRRHGVEIEIVGVCTDICVISNALIMRSMMPDIKITVDASCCAGTTPENHKKALDIMRNCNIDIINE